MLQIKKDVNIQKYLTFKIGGQVKYLIEINNKEDLKEACIFAKDKNIPIFILGKGSNIIFNEGFLDILVLKIGILGFEIIYEDNEIVDIKIGAGESLDKIIEKTVEMGYSGLEALSAIPGTVGATPVQNVGAYGTEVKDIISEVEVFNTKNYLFKKINNKDCKFNYRDSIFKNEAKNKYIITAVTYRLSKKFSRIPQYQDVIKYFDDRKIIDPPLKEIRDALIFIRSNKLPNPKEIPNVGSFFKNPIVEIEKFYEIKEKYPNIKFFPIDEKNIKIPAGWLIENAGLKGKSFGHISVYEKNALVLTNNGKATFKNLIDARDEIVKTVKDKFRIILEQEPEII